MTEFDWIRHSSIPAPDWDAFRFRSLRELLFLVDDESELALPVLVGVVTDEPTVVTLADLQVAYQQASAWCIEQQIAAGERVAVLRLPYASDLLVAINAIALMANGVRVVLPMQASHDSLTHLIQRTGCRYVLAPVESVATRRHPSTGRVLDRVNIARAESEILDCPTPVSLPLDNPFSDQSTSSPRPNAAPHHVDDEILILTTSSSTGRPKFVRYSERSLLTVAESWRAAGLLSERLTGGASLCPLFSHSMGVRNVLHAIWTRRPTLMIPPEWLDEAPHRVVGLLQAWPPQHFTGGPALIRALARLGNSIPEARRALRSLRTLVSSGSAWDDSIAGVFSNVRVANAFGMTETQQVLSTLSTPSADVELRVADGGGQAERGRSHRMTLGRPLPGVSVAVRFVDESRDTGRLFVKSIFKAIGYLGEPDFATWFETGDRVRIRDGELEFAGRDKDDFINLGSGLKFSSDEIERRYEFLAREFRGLIFRRSTCRMGVVAIAFSGDGDPEDPALHVHIRALVDSFHERLSRDRDDFELRQTLLLAIGLVHGEPPRTGTGKIDFSRVAREQSDLLESLNSSTGRHPRLVETEPVSLRQKTWYQHLRPYAGQLMQALELDVEFVDGDGDYLFRQVGGERQPVLDLVGGFGANLLGHGQRELQSIAIETIQRVPMLDQFSRRSAAAELAESLSSRFGKATGRRYVCIFHSTGSEAVETALKHALFKWTSTFDEWNDRIRQRYGSESPELVDDCLEYNRRQFASFRPLIIALQGGYHGKTTGALNVMSDEAQRTPFDGLLGARVLFVHREVLDSPRQFLDDVLAKEVLVLRRPEVRERQTAWVDHTLSGIIAAIVEPIQGEGGIHEVPSEWLAAIREAGVPMILDEIQCGLGRSGEFPASPGIAANYYLVGKALGGGIGKISATLIDRVDYCEKFDLQTGATFSDDAFSCNVALKVLQIIDRDDVPARAARLGVALKEKLAPIHVAHPEVLRNITGRGAMIGLELGLPNNAPRFLREVLREQLGYFAASYLLHRHAVRILPTLSAPRTLRVEPSAFLSLEAMNQLADGLDDFCQRMESSDALGLIQHLVPSRSLPDCQTPQREWSKVEGSEPRTGQRLNFQFSHESPASEARRVGFVFNPIYPTDELLVELPDLAELAIDQRLELARRLQILLQLRPIELFSRNLFDDRVWLCGIALPAAPESLDEWHRTGDLHHVRQRLEEALELATERGCQTVVFGAQTSIVSAGATSLQPQPGVQVSSGNSFTVAALLSQIEEARRRIGIPKHARLAVVGANGNIGSSIVRWFAARGHWEGPILMLGRAGSQSRLTALREGLVNATGNASLQVSQDQDELHSCDVIVVAVSAGGVVLQSQHVHANRAVLIADVSWPRAVSSGIAQDRPNATVVWAGLVRLPDDRGFRLTPHTPRGTCFACAAEGILMGLEPQPQLRLHGEIDPQAVQTLLRLGRKYGLIDGAPLS